MVEQWLEVPKILPQDRILQTAKQIADHLDKRDLAGTEKSLIHTNLDVKQEKRIDDYWNIDGSRDLSRPWTGFTQFSLLEEKPPEAYMWSGERLTRKQLTSRPEWPELWKTMGKNAKLKEKQKWSNEKLHLENARKLRGIYFIDRRIRNPKKPSRMLVRNWKHPLLLLCLAKL